MSKTADTSDKGLMVKALSRPDLLPEQFISWLRRFVLDNSLISDGSSSGGGVDSFLVPTAAILDFGGATAPTGFLLCDGTSYLRTDYPNLFTAISTTYGSADSTHFNVPDLRGRVAVGYAASGGHTDVATLGGNDGVATANRRAKHNHTNGLTLPNHVHAEQGAATTTHISTNFGTSAVQLTADVDTSVTSYPGNTSNPLTNPSIAGTIGPSGTNAVDAPSYLVTNKIIKI